MINAADCATRRRSRDFLVELVAARSPPSPRGATTSSTSSPTPTRRRARSARERGARRRRSRCCPRRCGAANTTFVNLRATLVDLDALVDASKPGDQDLAPFLASCARWCTTRGPRSTTCADAVPPPGPNNDLIDLMQKLPGAAERRQARRSRTRSRRCRRASRSSSSSAPTRPSFVGWLRDFGQGAANYDANGHYARIQPIFNAFSSRQPGRARCADARRPAPRRPSEGNLQRCPGAASQFPPDGSAPFRDRRQPRLRPVRGAARPMRRAARHRPCSPRRRGRARAGHRRERRRRQLPGARDLRQRRLRDPGRGREDRRRQGRQDRRRSTSRRDKKAAVVLAIDNPGFEDFRQDADCTIRPQSLIGEKFVECTPTQPRAPARAAPPPLREDRATARARASTCCR